MAPSRFMGIALICGIALTVMHQPFSSYAQVRTHEVRKDKYSTMYMPQALH